MLLSEICNRCQGPGLNGGDDGAPTICKFCRNGLQSVDLLSAHSNTFAPDPAEGILHIFTILHHPLHIVVHLRAGLLPSHPYFPYNRTIVANCLTSSRGPPGYHCHARSCLKTRVHFSWLRRSGIPVPPVHRFWAVCLPFRLAPYLQPFL